MKYYQRLFETLQTFFTEIRIDSTELLDVELIIIAPTERY